MITGTLPILDKQKNYANRHTVSKTISNIKAKKTFLYIGNSAERTTKCLSFFDHGDIKDNFADAQQHLLMQNEMEGMNVPDFIIIDQPLQEKELLNFMVWLHSNPWSFMIPVLYNETALKSRELYQLKQLGIADDIVNIEEYCNQLYLKAKFLRGNKLFNYNRVSTGGIKIKSEISLGKRVFDIVFSATLLILLSPLMLLITLLIKLESKGPAIYRSRRAGRGFKVFDFYKFRSMVYDADKKIDQLKELNLYANKKDENITFFKVQDDPRITRIGAFLRNTSLDELPQLVNVLKGDMSVVGNRPLPLYEASTLTTNTGAERFTAPAGITGLWQVTKRGRENMDGQERLQLDINYARSQGFRTDFRILLHTPLALFQKTTV